MDLEIVILRSKSYRAGEISYDVPFMWNLKRNDTNQLTCKIEKDSQRMNLWLPGGRTRGRDSWEVWSGHVHAAVFKMDNQQGPTV